MKLMKLIALTTLTAILTACDRAERGDVRDERADGLYKTAMEDFGAGRIDAAVKGFEKAIVRNPGNASARFQQACVLQDSKKDYLGAFCGYREYLRQRPESDKSKLAKDRMALCEKEMAKDLATKHGLLGSEGFANELENVRQELRAAETRLAAADKDVATYRTRLEALTAERNRLMAIIKGGDDESTVAAKPSVKEAKDLLEEEEDTVDRIKMSKDISALKAEEKSEVEPGASLLPQQTKADRDRRDAAKSEKQVPPPSDADAVPETYVVQEGDTLYRIAKRFYGRISAWKEIREANKALVTMDGRVRVGDTLILPKRKR